VKGVVTKSILEEGDNYRLELDDARIAHCTVWVRPDLDFEAGARLAARTAAVCSALCAGQARGMLFDLREAPKVTGPKTQQSLKELLGAWEAAARPVAIIVTPASMQMLQITRLARDAAPRHAEVFVEPELALQWLALRLPRRSTQPQSPPLEPAAGTPEAPVPAAATTGAQPSLPAASPVSLRAGVPRRG